MPVAGRPEEGSLNTSLCPEPSPPSVTGRMTSGDDALRFKSSARLDEPARDSTGQPRNNTQETRTLSTQENPSTHVGSFQENCERMGRTRQDWGTKSTAGLGRPARG